MDLVACVFNCRMFQSSVFLVWRSARLPLLRGLDRACRRAAPMIVTFAWIPGHVVSFECRSHLSVHTLLVCASQFVSAVACVSAARMFCHGQRLHAQIQRLVLIRGLNVQGGVAGMYKAGHSPTSSLELGLVHLWGHCAQRGTLQTFTLDCTVASSGASLLV